ncbi:MAG: FMN-binding protein [Candidatus Omnitrophota bacterium]|jgi:electron transport complex protein RnfG
MKEMIRFGFILGVICIVAAGLLTGVNSLTKPIIVAQVLAEERAGLKEVLPEAEKFEAVRDKGELVYYKGYDKNGKFIGVAFKADAKGYSSIIEVMAGMCKDGKIIAIKILSQNETPGLGSRIADPGFINRFKGINDLSSVQAITGATISSRAVIASIEKKALEIRGLIRNEK